MALLWLPLLLLLPSLLRASSVQPARQWLPVREGPPEGPREGPPAQAASLGPARGRWEWKVPGDGGPMPPLPARRKREGDPSVENSSAATKKQPPKSPSLPGTTTRPSPSLKTVFKDKPSPHIPAAPTKAAQEADPVAAPLTPTKSKVPPPAPSHSPAASPKPGKASTEAKHPKEGERFAPKGEAGMVGAGKDAATVALPESTTEHWPWLEEISSDTPPAPLASTTVLGLGLAVTSPGLKSKEAFASRATASPTLEGRQLDGSSRASAQTLADAASVATATVTSPALATTGLSFKAKGGLSPKTGKASPTTAWPWLDDSSTASSETLVDSSDASTVAQKTVERPRWRTKGKENFTSTASPTTADPGPRKPPSAAAGMVGNCLLGLFLLALVAAIFIVVTAVLAAMLWRQKQAYRMRQGGHTEMVCISSLLAAEEAEEARGRAPRGKRVKRLRENGSETEMDNLTLNSFLPEH